MKKSVLLEGLNAAAGRQPKPLAEPIIAPAKTIKANGGTVLIGGHFSREVRRTLLLVQAEKENSGKNLKQLLGEAINDLCAKYSKPQPYHVDE